MMFGTLFAFLVEHAELVDLLFHAITSGKLSKDSATKAIRDAMVAAADAEMRRELAT